VVSNVSAPDLIVKFYKHPTAPRYICQADFDAIFKSRTIALKYSNLEGRVSIMGPYQCYLWNTRPTS